MRIKKDQYRCSCCNRVVTYKTNHRWVKYDRRGANVAVCRSCFGKIQRTNYKTVKALTDVDKTLARKSMERLMKIFL